MVERERVGGFGGRNEGRKRRGVVVMDIDMVGFLGGFSRWGKGESGVS